MTGCLLYSHKSIYMYITVLCAYVYILVLEHYKKNCCTTNTKQYFAVVNILIVKTCVCEVQGVSIFLIFFQRLCFIRRILWKE